MSGILDMVASNLDLELRRLVFPESETPVYRIDIVLEDGTRDHFVWTPQDGIVTDSQQNPTAIVELRQQAMEALLTGEYTAQELFEKQLVRVGGIYSDIVALRSLWGSVEDVTESNASRARQAMSTTAKKAIIRDWKQKIAGGASTARIRDMGDRWAAHTTARCQLDVWTALDIEGLVAQPWHDPHELSLHAHFSDAWTEIRREAQQFLERTVSAPHYGADPSAADEPTAGRPQGWRHWNLIEHFDPMPDRRVAFPHTTRVLDNIASEYTVVHAGFLILEPGVSIALHSDGTNWCRSHHFGVIVPPNCHQTVAGERRYHAERESMLFDHSFIHSAANEGDGMRVLLNVVFANPALQEDECAAIRKLAADVRKGQIVYAR